MLEPPGAQSVSGARCAFPGLSDGTRAAGAAGLFC